MKSHKLFTGLFLLCCILFAGRFHAEAASLSFTHTTDRLKAGKTYSFEASLTCDSSEDLSDSTIHWRVSNTKIGTIDHNGTFLAKRVGKVKIFAYTHGSSISTTLQVTGKKVIGIDPGHQAVGNSSQESVGPGSSLTKDKVAGGTQGVATGIYEYQTTMKVAKKLKKVLWNRGYDVVLTRTTNQVNISNKARALKLNKSGADISIRLHCDGADSSYVRGVSALYPSSSNPYVGSLSKKSKKLAKTLLSSYCSVTGLKNNGAVVRDDLTGTNFSKIPVVVLEMGYMTNPTEDYYLNSKKGQTKIAKGIADGIDEYHHY